MPSTRIALGLDATSLRELSFLATSADSLPRLVKSIENIPPGKDLSEIVDTASSALEMPPSSVERILNALQNLRRWMAGLHKSAGWVVDSIAEDFRQHVNEEDGDSKLERWLAARGTVSDAVQAIAGDHPLNLARKTERVAHAHENLLSEVRIVTELRPIFTEAADSIKHSIITHTLVIDYVEGRRVRRIALGLDAADVSTLIRIAQRAEIKAATIKEAMKGLAWQTVAYGETTGDDPATE